VVSIHNTFVVRRPNARHPKTRGMKVIRRTCVRFFDCQRAMPPPDRPTIWPKCGEHRIVSPPARPSTPILGFFRTLLLFPTEWAIKPFPSDGYIDPRRQAPIFMPPTNPHFGAHMSVAGGLDKAFYAGAAVGCDCMQIFVKKSAAVARQVVRRGRDGCVSDCGHPAFSPNS